MAEEIAPYEPPFAERAEGAFAKLPKGLQALARIVLEVDDVIFGDEPRHEHQVANYYKIAGNKCHCSCGMQFKWSSGAWEMQSEGSYA